MSIHILAEPDADDADPHEPQWVEMPELAQDDVLPAKVWEKLRDTVEERCKGEDAERRQVAAAKATSAARLRIPCAPQSRLFPPHYQPALMPLLQLEFIHSPVDGTLVVVSADEAEALDAGAGHEANAPPRGAIVGRNRFHGSPSQWTHQPSRVSGTLSPSPC